MSEARGELALGCMRLSTEASRDEARALLVLQAAFDAGFAWLDTADAYAHDAAEAGHNERLVAQALRTWAGDRTRVRVATKGGLVRPQGRWEADGRARHLRTACEASRRALGLERIHLYQLHAPDPRTPLATSVRALQGLRRDGLVESVGLCNVTLRQLEDALRLGPLASVQVELSPWRHACLHDGVAERCRSEGVRLLAYRPLGGMAGRPRIEAEEALREVGARHGATACEVALAWLRDLSPLVLPLPGATRPESIASIARAARIELSSADRERLDERFPAGRVLRSSGSRARPPVVTAPPDGAEVVLVMGLPGAGKSTLAEGLVAQGYERLNRDQKGGRLASLLPALDGLLAGGRRRVVLDNTYVTRRSRAEVVERAAAHGVPVRCVWLQTSLEDAQLNAVRRMLGRYGRLLEEGERARAAKSDPGSFGPSVQFRYARDLEPPGPAEGFSRIDRVAFRREPDPSATNAATVLWLDGLVWGSRSGRRVPSSSDDVFVAPERAEVLRRHAALGTRLLGLTWQPEVEAGALALDTLEASLARLRDLLGAPLEVLQCPHVAGPPRCWCRKPLPGLGLQLVLRHRLDPARCVYVGQGGQDRLFAERLGFAFQDAADFFATGAAAPAASRLGSNPGGDP